jgi:UDP-GlcNAc:undecaprenyl-phosphate GlcNAc-1-phosphate transferase
MGDSGSNWLGFMMGIFLIFTVEGIGLMPSSMGSYAIARLEHTQPVMFISTLLCLSVPIFDSASVIFHRWFRGLSPMAPDKRHLHHSMLKLGLSHSQSVIAVYFVNLVVGIMGVIPIAFERYPLDWLPYLSMFIFLTILYFSVSMEDLSIKAIFGRNPLIKKTIESGAGAQMFLNTWETVNRYTIYVILVATPLFAGVAPATIGLAAIATTPLLILSIVLKNTNTDFLQCVFLAISTTIVLMANNANRIWVVFSGTGYSLQSFYNVAFVWLACSSLAFIIFTFRRRYLVFNPSDFLMVALPLLLTLVPEPFNNEYRLNIIALRALIMFMAIKSLAKRRHKVSYRLSFILLISCLYVFLTSVLNMRIVYT